MNRFQEDFPSDAVHMLKVWEGPDAFDPPGNVLICENCRQSCDKLYDVPEFEFKGCGRCFDEAVDVLIAEEKEAAATAPARIPVARMQGDLFTEVA